MQRVFVMQRAHRTAWNVRSTDLASATPASVDLKHGSTPPPRHAKVTERRLICFIGLDLAVENALDIEEVSNLYIKMYTKSDLYLFNVL